MKLDVADHHWSFKYPYNKLCKHHVDHGQTTLILHQSNSREKNGTIEKKLKQIQKCYAPLLRTTAFRVSTNDPYTKCWCFPMWISISSIVFILSEMQEHLAHFKDVDISSNKMKNISTLQSIILLFGQQMEHPRLLSRPRNSHVNWRKIEK